MRWSLLERLVEPSTPPPWLLVGLSLLAVVLLLRPSAKLTPLRGVALALGCLLAGLCVLCCSCGPWPSLHTDVVPSGARCAPLAVAAWALATADALVPRTKDPARYAGIVAIGALGLAASLVFADALEESGEIPHVLCACRLDAAHACTHAALWLGAVLGLGAVVVYWRWGSSARPVIWALGSMVVIAGGAALASGLEAWILAHVRTMRPWTLDYSQFSWLVRAMDALLGVGAGSVAALGVVSLGRSVRARRHGAALGSVWVVLPILLVILVPRRAHGAGGAWWEGLGVEPARLSATSGAWLPRGVPYVLSPGRLTRVDPPAYARPGGSGPHDPIVLVDRRATLEDLRSSIPHLRGTFFLAWIPETQIVSSDAQERWHLINDAHARLQGLPVLVDPGLAAGATEMLLDGSERAPGPGLVTLSGRVPAETPVLRVLVALTGAGVTRLVLDEPPRGQGPLELARPQARFPSVGGPALAGALLPLASLGWAWRRRAWMSRRDALRWRREAPASYREAAVRPRLVWLASKGALRRTLLRELARSAGAALRRGALAALCLALGALVHLAG